MTNHTISRACSMCNGPLGSGANKRTKTRGFGLCYPCMKKGAPDEYRCQSQSTKGTRCRKWRSRDSDFCSYHEVKE